MQLMNLITISLVFSIAIVVAVDKPWMNLKDTPAQRAQKLVDAMTLDEKLALVHGYGGPYVGNVAANTRLNIPELHLEDGPQGVADGVRLVTGFPSALTVVVSWDTAVMENYATAMGKEQRAKGTNIMLGPMVNIARIPQGGRNFESFGEDPYLAGEMAFASVTGIQSNGIIATVKHYVDNNQEYHRNSVSANVDERTQHEIYYPAFKRAVDANVGSVMCSYNRINDTYASANYQTLTIDLKKEMGFQGFVQSDWGAVHTTINAANNGLDLEMPNDQYFGAALKAAVAAGQVPVSRVSDMVLRILTSLFAVGIMDNPPTGNLGVNVTSAEHNMLSRALAIEGTVLLKNEKNILPLSKNAKIAVLGDDGQNNVIVIGGGSGHVIPPYVVTPYAGIKAVVNSATYAPTSPLQNAVAAAKAADVAVVFVGVFSSEGSDRPNLSLGNGQDELIAAVAAAQPNTVVVIHSPGAVLVPWINSVPAAIAAFYPGEEAGNAIADVLFGDANPSGKLPITFPLTEDQVPANTTAQYPGINDEGSYSEGLFVGYRWYDRYNQDPAFPFGHGLSYTTFEYSNLQIKGLTISGSVQNTGKVAGAEVVQLYIGYPESANEPPKVLRGFKKLRLQPGVSGVFSFTLTEHDLSIWDITTVDWTVIHGTFSVYVGSSSRDIRLKGVFQH